MTIFGIDINHFQAGIDLARAAGGDTTFVVAKMTEGQGVQDPQYETYRRHAEQLGLLFAGYHYLRGDSSVMAQARNVKEVVGDSKVPVIIDLERTNGAPQPTLTDAEHFRAAATALGVVVPRLIYLPEWYWKQIGSPNTARWDLWQSNYGSNTGKYPGDTDSRWITGGRKAQILQFTSRGRVAGYSGDIDVDAYLGTRDELAATGWFIDYRPPQEPDLTPEDVKKAVAATPIVVDGAGTTQTLQRVLRRLLNAQRTPDEIAKAVAKALPTPAPGTGGLTQADVEEAVKQAFREGTA